MLAYTICAEHARQGGGIRHAAMQGTLRFSWSEELMSARCRYCGVAVTNPWQRWLWTRFVIVEEEF